MVQSILFQGARAEILFHQFYKNINDRNCAVCIIFINLTNVNELIILLTYEQNF